MSLLIKNIKMVDVLKNDIYTTDIYIRGGRIEKVEKNITLNKKEVNKDFVLIYGRGCIAIPGLIDAHTHVELSMLSSAPFAEACIANGTTAAVLDPHDAVNVLGHRGAKYLMQEMKKTELTPVWMASACVPSAPGYEDCYGQITLSDVKTMVEKYGMYGIAEAMDYERVISGEESLAEILAYGKEKGLKIDGHAPCVRGEDLDAYIEAGVTSDHESVTVEEMLEKHEKGMYVIIRRGSLKEPASAKELLDKTGDSDHILLSTDACITVQDILAHGHMNYALAQLIEEGVDVMQAVKMATLYPARAYGLHDRGAIAPGYYGDIVILENMDDFKVRNVIVNGKLAKKTYKRCRFPKTVMNSIRHRPITDADLKIALPENAKASGGVKAHILQIVDGTLETLHEERELSVIGGSLQLEEDLMYCAVIDRYKQDGSVGMGIISNAGSLKGAFAGSIAQDTQNLIVFGNNISDMVEALNQVIKKQGGMSYVRDGREEQFIGLPVLGILSQDPIEVFAAETDILAYIKPQRMHSEESDSYDESSDSAGGYSGDGDYEPWLIRYCKS